MKPLVISIHGIRTRGEWQKQLTAELNRAGFVHEPLDYGFFRAVRLLWPPARQHQIRWFLEQYTLAVDHNGGAPISLVAHSFGSYLASRSLEQFPEVTFDRMILCGSIVRRDYPWTRIIREAKQTNQVLNDYGRLDLWSGVAGWLISDAGASGRQGFLDTAAGSVIQREHQEFRHSDYFYRLNYQRNWIPFLQGLGPGPLSRQDRHRPNWEFAIIGVVMVLVLSVIAFTIWSRVGPPRIRACDETRLKAVDAYTRDRATAAESLFRQAASCRTDLALMWLAHLRHRGLLDFERSPEQSSAIAVPILPRIETLANAGSSEAQFLLGSAYLYGMGVSQNGAKGLNLVQASANQGFAIAQYTLAVLLDRGANVEHNAAETDRLLRLAASGGVPQAAIELAERMKREERFDEAFNWYKEAVDLGDSNALVAIGNMLQAGLGRRADPCAACQAFEKAANARNADGQANLGVCFLDGVQGCTVNSEIKFQKDCRQARRLFENSISISPPNLTGMYNLGVSLLDGRDDCPSQDDDARRGLQYVELAARGGYEPAVRFLSDQGTASGAGAR